MLRHIVPRESWQNQSQPGRTLRSAQTGQSVPCGSCGDIFLNGDYCASCGLQRIGLEPKPKGAIDLEVPCRCGSKLAKSGAGRRPNEQSLHCYACQKFICYQPIGKPKNRRKPGLEHISGILARLQFERGES